MKGTTFTVDLPLRTAVPSEGDSADEPASEGGSGGGQHAQKKAILVADDEPSILSLLYDTLKEKGYAVETAPSGNAALRKLKTRSFDLILTDVKMPGLSGIELYDRVRTEFPGLESRIVFMSGTPSRRRRASSWEIAAIDAFPSRSVRPTSTHSLRDSSIRRDPAGQPDPWRGSSPSPARPDSRSWAPPGSARWRKTNGPCGSGSGAGLMGRCGSWNGLLSGASIRRSCLRAPGRSSSWVSRTSRGFSRATGSPRPCLEIRVGERTTTKS